MDMHVVRWGVTAAVVIGILCIVYMFMNFRAAKKPAAQAASGGWTVYGSNKCGWTRKQTEEMDAKGVKYTFVDCDKENCPGVSGFPTLKNDDGTVKVGYTPM
jgi:hypothetical protein